MIRLLTLFLIIVPVHVFSQGYINKSRAGVRQAVEKILARNDTIRFRLRETDTSLHFMVRDPNLWPADFIYTFDEAGKCNSEEVIAGCDSCFNQYLETALRNKKYRWKKLNDRLYISQFSKNMLLEIPANNTGHSFFIRRLNWTRSTYKTLLTSK